MKTKPYVGITGFMSSAEVTTVLNLVDEKQSAERQIMVGVLASLKTIRGEKNKWPGRYPKTNDIKDIFLDDARALNLVHYNTKEPESLYSQLTMMTGVGGRLLHGFQLNIPWPNPTELERYVESHYGKMIVLQVGAGAYEMVERSPKALAAKIRDEYDDLIDYVLLDPSGGAGKPFDLGVARDQIEKITAKCSALVGVAGGLHGNNLESLDSLISDFPELSIDAEGQLRTPQPGDTLDMAKASTYITRSFEMFSRVV